MLPSDRLPSFFAVAVLRSRKACGALMAAFSLSVIMDLVMDNLGWVGNCSSKKKPHDQLGHGVLIAANGGGPGSRSIPRRRGGMVDSPTAGT